jgi:hypothetical protein
VTYLMQRQGNLAGTGVPAPTYTRQATMSFSEGGGILITRQDTDPRLPSTQPEVRPVAEAEWSGGQFAVRDRDGREFEFSAGGYPVREGLEEVVEAARNRERPSFRVGGAMVPIEPTARLAVLQPQPGATEELLEELRDIGVEVELPDGRIRVTSERGAEEIRYLVDPSVGAVVQIETVREGHLRSRTNYLHRETSSGGWELQAIELTGFGPEGEVQHETLRYLDRILTGPQLGGG